MKNKSLLDLAVLATVCAIFLTSSFDLVGTIKVMGFTLRVVYLFVLIGAGLTLYRWIKLKELILPEGFVFLGFWMTMVLAFIPNSPFVIRNVGYGIWLVLNVSTIFLVVNFMNRDNMGAFLRVYIVSFFVVSLLGIVQYISPQIGLPSLAVKQWWVPDVLPRVNAFTYEPSFFATYLLFGIPAMLILLARGKLMGIPQWLFYTMLSVDVTALIVCSSRMGILIFFVFLAGFMVHVIVRWIRERRLGLHLAMSFALPLFVAVSVLMIMDMRLRQVKTDVGYAFYLGDTGWMEKDITKGNSFKNRVQMMEKTFEVFQKNPVIGVSLGGIAPWIANTHFTNITSNDQVKPFEGINVPLEVLAASGVIGFVIFCIFIFRLCRPLLKKGPDGGDKDYYIALFWGFALGFIMLVENQNILRPYVWAHMALMAGVIHVLGKQSPKKRKDIAMANNYRKWSGTGRLTDLVEQVVGGHPKTALARLHMKALAILALMVLCVVPSFGQTVLIDPNGDGGFENASTFAGNGWTAANHTINSWELGTAALAGGTRGAYISYNVGATYDYAEEIAQVSHFYRDVTFPLDQKMIVLRFALMGGDGNTGSTNVVKVFLTSTETTPVGGIPLADGQLGLDEYWNESKTHRTYAIIIPFSAAGTTKRLVFSWENDEFGGSAKPAAIDNISLQSEGGITSNGTGGGPWSSGSTWEGGETPAMTDNVIIRDGDAVTIDADAEIKNLAVGEGVSGLLEFDPLVNRRLTVQNHLVVSDGGAFTSGATGTGTHELILGGDLVNNGTVDFSTNGGQAKVAIEFNSPTGQEFTGPGQITDISSITVFNATTTATTLLAPENLTVQGTNTGASGFLNPVRGTVRLSGEAPLSGIVFSSAPPVIATTTAVWFDNPNLVLEPQNSGLTVQGTLRVSGGVVNIGEDQDDCIILSNGSTFIMEGGAVNVSAAIGVTSTSHAVKFQLHGGDITVQRFGNSSTTFAGFDLGTSSFTSATSTAGSITVEQANTALTGPGDFRVPLGFNITGGELHLGNATTTAATTFRIRGAIPNLVIDQTHNHIVQLFQTSTFLFSTVIPPGATLDLNGTGLSVRGNLDIASGATLIGNAAGSSLTFGGSVPQVFNSSGTIVDGLIRSLVILNSSGGSPAVSVNTDLAIANSLFLTNGSLGGSGTVTLGSPGVSSTFTMTRVNGELLTPATFDLDGVVFNGNYNTSLTPMTTGPELPSVVSGTLTINNTQGVYLSATTTVAHLALTNGVLNTATSTAVEVSGTAPTDIAYTSGYVQGPIIINLPPSLDGSIDYRIPVGTSRQRTATLKSTKTDPTPNTRVMFQAYDFFGEGTPGDGISRLPDGLRWFVTVLTGGGDITETRISFSDEGLGNGNRIAKSATIDGAYNSIGGTVSGTTITSDVFNSFSYFAIGLTDNAKSGILTVGVSGDYPTLTDAVADLDTSALGGPVTLSLLDATYPSETFPIIIRQIAGISATNTLTIKPAAGVSSVISGQSFDFTGLIKLEGADYVTIDGSNNGTDSRDMTIACTDTYNPMIWLSSQGTGLGAKNNTIKNLNLSGGISQVSTNSGPHAIIASGTTPISNGADNDSNKVHNNLITKVRYGVVFQGVSGNPNEGNSVTNNYIGSAAFGADQIGKVGIGATHQSGIIISGNTIRSLGSIHPNIPDGAGDDRVGIALGADSWPPSSTSVISNAVVTENIIQDIVEESVHSSVGILLAASGTNTNNLIANNMISGVRANGTSGEYGAGIGFHSGQGDKIVFNSIRMEGDIDPGSSTTATGSNIGINVRGGSNLTVKNNIISADLTSNTGTLEHYAITVPSSYSWGTGGIDYNDYFINTSNTQMKLGGTGSAVPYTPFADLTDWKTNFSATQDANSKSFAPDFTSTSDLHLNVTSADVNYAGTPIAGVTTDIDGDARGAGSPYIGADEVTAYPIIVSPAAPVLAYPADNATGVTTDVELQWNPSPGADEYELQVATDAGFVSLIVNESALPDTSFLVSSLSNSTEYHWRVLASNSAGAGPYSSAFSFVTVAPTPTPPAAPAGLMITDSSSRTITIKWLKNAEPDFLRYRIYRGTAPNPTTQVDSTTGGIGDTLKTLTNLTNGTRYYLRVTAVDSAGSESGYSNEVSAVPADRIPPAAPQNLVITDSSSTQIVIAWSKNADADLLKYMIYRGTAPNPTTLVDSSTASISDTNKTFTGLVNGTRYYFRVTALDSARNESVYSNEVNAAPDVASGISDLLNQIPTEYSLSQNYPNPFNPSTVIRYGIPERSSVRVEVYDMLGRRIAVLVDLEQDAKYYEVIWNSDNPSGIYFYRIKAVAVADHGRVFEQIRKMVFVK